MDLKKGDIVRFSQHGIESMNPKNPDRVGILVKDPQHQMAQYVHVKWNGYKSVLTYNPSFIEKMGTDERMTNGN